MNFKYQARLMACLFFIPILGFSKILKDEVMSFGVEEFSYNSVCKKMLGKDLPLIEYKNANTLDCMGTEVKVGSFCDKEMPETPYLIRGFIDSEKSKIICKKGKKVVLKATCTGDYKCIDTELDCYKLGQIYAIRLHLDHHSSFIEKKQKIINCYFTVKKKIVLPQ
jgi:hypothetical protein